MTKYNTWNVTLPNLQLNELKSGTKNSTDTTLNLSSNLTGNSDDGTNFPHKLLLNGTQVSKIKASANGSLANIKFSKTHLSKMIQSGGFMTDISGIISGLHNFVNFSLKVLESYSKGLSNTDTKKYKNNK